ncbi:flagellar hook assembly protein FlgD [Pseudoprimorskyibacter insulae]|uniref:Basal-body rod modification protein FlgD n=1 Tax=Pseudoprimorskyibacter insulae TaxID=1695997 RepID=A0A2R8AVR7_9RHOB|nr:flagellar hook capping FlgD N-terminal domain-containing protein [Pseudoprimorskyibacter insulae]SPF80113.1 Basal-body rod modification protein FlgD [Pseudoprimorskyibacter insulae]
MTSVSELSVAGLRTTEDLAPAAKGGTSELGQQDFLTLMTAQLKNQDPFSPMENGEFLAQMAQFSTVSGLDTINETLQGLSEQMGGDRILTSASLLGKQVLVTGTTARPDADGQIIGTVDLPSAGDVQIRYSDATTGQPLATQDMGNQSQGAMEFAWSDVPQSIRDARSAVKVSVVLSGDSGTSLVTPQVYARVTGVRVPAAGETDFNVQVEDYGLKNSMEISSLR